MKLIQENKFDLKETKVSVTLVTGETVSRTFSHTKKDFALFPAFGSPDWWYLPNSRGSRSRAEASFKDGVWWSTPNNSIPLSQIVSAVFETKVTGQVTEKVFEKRSWFLCFPCTEEVRVLE
jgi:hypothetical protein